jgi:hypothetical protein
VRGEGMVVLKHEKECYPIDSDHMVERKRQLKDFWEIRWSWGEMKKMFLQPHV